MKTLILQEVNGEQIRVQQAREAMYFTLATWLKTDPQYTSDFRLLLEYYDSTGEHRAEIDRAGNLADSTVLLTGAVILRPQGPVTQMRVLLECTSPMAKVRVENLNVRRVYRGNGISAAA